MKTSKQTLKRQLITAALSIFSAASLIFAAGGALGNTYGTEITIHDGLSPNGAGAAKEDNEAEVNMVQNQSWDLEGFFLKGTKLTIVAGFNFYTGNEGMMAGDIFIDTNGDAVHSPAIIPDFNYNPGYKEVSNADFKYDYVLDINWDDGTFDILQIGGIAILKDTLYGAQYNMASNPWRYESGGVSIGSGSFNTYGENSQEGTGFLGWGGDTSHYIATFDITGVDLSKGALFHNTIECGNDNLLGQVAPVPEPATMLLFGTGLVGLAGMARKRRQK